MQESWVKDQKSKSSMDIARFMRVSLCQLTYAAATSEEGHLSYVQSALSSCLTGACQRGWKVRLPEQMIGWCRQ